MVWCATAGHGLYKFLFNQRATPLISRFDTEQGLPSQKVFAALPTPNQVLWIGTNNGAVRYETNQTRPAIKLSRVIGNRAYQPQEIEAGLNLEYPQNSLLVEATAIGSRTFPEQFQYDFTLVDAKGNLVAQKLSRDSQMLMQDLRNGNYHLSVSAFTNDLTASELLTINFAVQRAPFPWTSTGLAILLLLALLAIWWGYRQNVKIVRSHEVLAVTNQQLAATRMQLANETETERRRIARDLHDQTLADLRRLMMLTDQLPATGKANGHQPVEPKIFRGEIEAISAEIRRICEDLSPSVLENVGFAAALEWALTDAVAHLPADRKFEYEFSCDEAIEENLHIPPVMQIHIYRIAQEVINNISRHADATRVRLSARLAANDEFVLEIEDNGPGFDLESAGKTGRGIANIRTRASLIDAEVGWIKVEDSGTLFTLHKTAGAKAVV
jgi:signal transduction histidine kinase